MKPSCPARPYRSCLACQRPGTMAAMRFPRFQFRLRTLMIVVTLLAVPLDYVGCSQRESRLAKRPVSADGEVFLQGPDGARTKVSLGRDSALALCELLDSGTAADELKDQGLAVLTIAYETSGGEHWQIGQSGVAWCEKKAVQTDI